jgi:DNA-binding MarR family transcriptional regulator
MVHAMSKDVLSPSLIEQLSRTTRLLKTELAQRLEGLDFSVDELLVLKGLAGGPRSMGELAELLALNHPTLTKMVDRLVSANAVYRTPDTADRRRVLIHLAERGRDQLAAALPHFHDVDRQFVKRFPKTAAAARELGEQARDLA